MPPDTPILSALDPRSDLAGALVQWRALIGAEHVLTDDATLSRYARSTSAAPRRPAAVLRPAGTEEVIGIVEAARRHRTPLYPISTGQNWGYGDACAVHDGQVIVELKRMDRIVEVDAELGYAVIEPGVTQQQLADCLRERQVPFWIDCTGAGPNSSLIGNIVERGFGHTPYGNRFQTVSGMEVVLGTGELLKTGFGRFENARTTHVYPYGLGPYLDGLFSQSNFGIVTRLGLWLLPIPEKCTPFLVSFAQDEDFFTAIAELRRLRMQRVLHSIPHIGNDLRGLASANPFPRDRVPAGARLPMEVRRELRKAAGVGAWIMSGALYGTRAEVAWRRRELSRALRGTGARIVFLTPGLLAAGRFAAAWAQRLGGGTGLRDKLEVAGALAGMHMGRPTHLFLRGSFWRHRSGIPEPITAETDLAQEGAGILWLAPIIPMRRADMEAVYRGVDAIFERHGFDCHVTVNLLSERAFAGVFTVEFDAEDPAEATRARDCYDASLAWLLAQGYPPYRLGAYAMGGGSMELAGAAARVNAELGGSFDPEGIVAPGRYAR
jgi:4-cresol dehydrogenase (hydroxylating)